MKIGDSDALEVGEWVLAIGSPFGLEHTAPRASSARSAATSQRYLRAVHPKRRRGQPRQFRRPLFNLRGEVVGINSQIYSSTGGYMGLSFAIPIKLAMRVVEQIKSTGEVTRGWLVYCYKRSTTIWPTRSSWIVRAGRWSRRSCRTAGRQRRLQAGRHHSALRRRTGGGLLATAANDRRDPGRQNRAHVDPAQR